jgi:DNA-binding transcriptional LysR family regulator
LAIEIDQPWIDRALEALGTPRRIAVSMPYFALAPSILPGTELILTIAAQLAHDNADRARIRVLAAPREFGELRFYAVWHPRFDQDPSHRWLRHVERYRAGSRPVNPISWSIALAPAGTSTA